MKKIIITATICVVIIVLAITMVVLKVRKSNDNLTKIRVNEVTRSVFYAPQYVAIANGYFAEEGLEIELTTGQGADKVMTAVLANQSDIGFARTRSIYLCI